MVVRAFRILVLALHIVVVPTLAVGQLVTLWVSRTCPYAARAWIACNEHVKSNPDRSLEVKIVDLQNKPDDFRELYKSISPDESASAKVPILQDGDFNLIESAVITHYIAERYATLKPSTEEDAYGRLLADLYEKTLGALTFKILQASGESAASSAVIEHVRAGICNLDNFFIKHGHPKGPYVAGSIFSYGDIMCAPFVQRLLPVAQHYVGCDIIATCDELKAHRLKSWIQAILARPSVVELKVPDAELIEAYDKLFLRFSAMRGPE